MNNEPLQIHHGFGSQRYTLGFRHTARTGHIVHHYISKWDWEKPHWTMAGVEALIEQTAAIRAEANACQEAEGYAPIDWVVIKDCPTIVAEFTGDDPPTIVAEELQPPVDKADS